METLRLFLYIGLILTVLAIFFYLRKRSTPMVVNVEPKLATTSSRQSGVSAPQKDSLKEKAELELKNFYIEAKPDIPEDETTCASVCPFGKPYSTDLPVANMPMCALLSQKSYKLSQFN